VQSSKRKSHYSQFKIMNWLKTKSHTTKQEFVFWKIYNLKKFKKRIWALSMDEKYTIYKLLYGMFEKTKTTV